MKYATYIGWRRACRRAAPGHQVLFAGSHAATSAYIEYRGPSETHRIDVGKWTGKPGVVEAAPLLPKQARPFPTSPVPAAATPCTFAIDPDDDMIAVANAAGRDSLTLKAASIVLPLLRAKKVTPRMIRVLLEEILKARKEISKSDRPDFIEYLRQIPKTKPNARLRRFLGSPSVLQTGEFEEFLRTRRAIPVDPPTVFETTRAFRARRKRFIALAGSCPDLPDVEPQPESVKTVFDRIRALRARQKPLPKGKPTKLIRAAGFGGVAKKKPGKAKP